MAQPEKKIVLKSLTAEITSHKDIEDLIGYALINQHEFERILFSPYENDEWDPNKKFIIDVHMIDCVYDVECSDRIDTIDSSYSCQIYCRVFFENSVYYVNMFGSMDYDHGWDCKYCGVAVIYFTKSPIYFFNHVISRDFDVRWKEKNLQSLVEDGFKIPLLDTEYHIQPKK